VATESIRKTDSFDWTGAKFIFEFSASKGYTQLKFTYDGVVYENEFDRLSQICNLTVKELFYKIYRWALKILVSQQQSPSQRLLRKLVKQ
jgi:hypothetical protein